MDIEVDHKASVRVYACIQMRVPASGNAELDAMIRQANRRDVAAKALDALISDGLVTRRHQDSSEPDPARYKGHSGEQAFYTLASDAFMVADALLAELERTQGK